MVLTEKRVAAFAFSISLIKISLGDQRLKRLLFSAENDHTLCISFEAADFHPDHSGRVEYRWSTALAEEFVRKLKKVSA